MGEMTLSSPRSSPATLSSPAMKVSPPPLRLSISGIYNSFPPRSTSTIRYHTITCLVGRTSRFAKYYRTIPYPVGRTMAATLRAMNLCPTIASGARTNGTRRAIVASTTNERYLKCAPLSSLVAAAKGGIKTTTAALNGVQNGYQMRHFSGVPNMPPLPDTVRRGYFHRVCSLASISNLTYIVPITVTSSYRH
jgi:hypothetical protein